jgi:hypothetical protein
MARRRCEIDMIETPSPEELRERLGSSDPGVRLAALHQVRARGLLVSVMDAVVPLIDDPDPSVACEACLRFAFHRAKRETAPALPRILAAFRAGRPEVRRAALVALVNLPYRPAIPSLMDSVSDPDPEIRWGAVTALMNLGTHAEWALKAIEGVLDDEDERVRRMASGFIQNLRGLAAPILPALERAMAARPENRSIYRLARFAVRWPALFDCLVPFLFLEEVLRGAAGTLAWRVRNFCGTR